MKTISKKARMILILFLCTGLVHASDTLSIEKKIAVQSVFLNANINGSGFGMQYLPSASIRFGNRLFISGSMAFCSGSWKKTGTSVGAGYLLLTESKSYSGHISLSINFSLMKIKNAYLSPASVEYEKCIASGIKNNESTYFENLHYSGWEYATGFCLNYRFRYGLLLKTSIGYAFTQSHQDNFPLILTSRENHIGSLQLSAGIGWGFGKMKSRTQHDMDMLTEEQEENYDISQN